MMVKIKKIRETSVYHAKIPYWPKDERPREKLLSHGAEVLSDAELIAILIRTGTGKITAVDLAKTLISHYKTLPDLAARTVKDLMQFHGLGVTKAVTLVAAFEIARRTSIQHRGEKFQIRSPEDVVHHYLPQMRDLKQEEFYVLMLDSANHLLREKKVSTGILNSSLVHPREVFRFAILEPAASIILLHNHPSGNSEPSKEDIQVTQQLVEAGKIIGIPVRDHIIIAGYNYTSFAEKGLI